LETLGNQIGNIINNHLELGENMLGTIWNIMGTPKICRKSSAFLVEDNGKGHELWGHRLKEFGPGLSFTVQFLNPEKNQELTHDTRMTWCMWCER